MTESLFPDDMNDLNPKQLLAHMQDPEVLSRWEGSILEMVELTEIALRGKLGDSIDVSDLARHVVLALCETMGGSVMYLPRGSALKRAMRDAAIYHDWRENNISPTALVRKYRLASQTIYEIIARQRALHRKREPDLFGFDQRTIQ